MLKYYGADAAYDLSGKTVIPFCTSHSSGISGSLSTLKNYNKNIKGDWNCFCYIFFNRYYCFNFLYGFSY